MILNKKIAARLVDEVTLTVIEAVLATTYTNQVYILDYLHMIFYIISSICNQIIFTI